LYPLPGTQTFFPAQNISRQKFLRRTNFRAKKSRTITAKVGKTPPFGGCCRRSVQFPRKFSGPIASCPYGSKFFPAKNFWRESWYWPDFLGLKSGTPEFLWIQMDSGGKNSGQFRIGRISCIMQPPSCATSPPRGRGRSDNVGITCTHELPIPCNRLYG